MSGAPAVALLGFGELAEALARRLAEMGVAPPRAYSRAKGDAAADAALRERIGAAGAVAVGSPVEAVAGADLVLACVPAGAAPEVAAQAAPHLAADALYADLASAAPEVKHAAAATVAAAGARYADAAVLGAVAASGAAVPILAAGPGAAALVALAPALGLRIRALDGPPGAAARVKLLRSVYLKGRDALVAEMLLAARRDGLEEAVIASIAGPGEDVPFPALADRVMGSLALHAGRRADELAAAGAMLGASGVQGAATAGAEARLRLIADAGLREAFAAGRPGSAAEVLDALERVGAS